MNFFFTSDEHYGHKKMIEFLKRPFADVTEMREAMIANHNAKVKPGDITYHLGDMFWRDTTPPEAVQILKRLNGQHMLLRGNHEETGWKVRNEFAWTGDLKRVHIPPFAPIVLCHYAMRVWDGSHRGTWHLFGHSHGQLDQNLIFGKSFDVGVDCWNFAPLSIDEVADEMAKREQHHNVSKIWPGKEIATTV